MIGVIAVAAAALLVALVAALSRYRTSYPGMTAPTATGSGSGSYRALRTSAVITQSSASSDFPDSRLTPGAVGTSDVATICRAGFATSIRPTGALWLYLKNEAYVRYGLPRGRRSTVDANGIRHPAYEVDHLIPLELGGDPTDLRNLWPEPIDSAKQKDVVENELHDLVCSGKMPLTRAQTAIAHDWETAVPDQTIR